MEPFLGEIRTFPYNFTPVNWKTCDGSLLPINQNQALFSLLGTTYGGNGTTNFALPDLRGRTMLHAGISPVSGTTYTRGNGSGVENVTLTTTQIPAHNHLINTRNETGTFTLNILGQPEILAIPAVSAQPGNVINGYTNSPSSLVALGNETISPAGGNVAHNNMPPFLTLNICICVNGYFPPRS